MPPKDRQNPPINIGSDNGLVSLCNKPLPETILSMIHSGVRRQMNECQRIIGRVDPVHIKFEHMNAVIMYI